MWTSEGGESHEFLFGIGTSEDEFDYRLSVGGIVELVLHHLEEEDGLFICCVVVNAGGIKIEDLTVEDFLR